jgi:hypothetical protein
MVFSFIAATVFFLVVPGQTIMSVFPVNINPGWDICWLPSATMKDMRDTKSWFTALLLTTQALGFTCGLL